MLSSSNVKRQLLLHLLRLIFLVPVIIISRPLGDYYYYAWLLWWIFFSAVIWTCVNDVYMLTWDTYTHGSVLASIIPQIFASLFLMVLSFINAVILAMASWDPLQLNPISPGEIFVLMILCFICATLLAVHIILWVKAPQGAFKRGVKDLQDQLGKDSGVSVFGWRRPASERRQLYRGIIRGGRRIFINIIFRRVDGVESLRFAATRNITSILLLTMLVGESVVLFRGVIHEDFPNRENWIDMADIINPFQILGTEYSGIIYANGTSQSWSVHFLLGMSETFNASTDDVIQSETTCYEEQFYPKGLEICRNWNASDNPAQIYVFDVVLIASLNGTGVESTPNPGRIWIEYPDLYSEVRFDSGIQLVPSWHLFGYITITVRRTIVPSFPGMLGLPELYSDSSMTSIDLVERTALDNASVARATLQLLPPENAWDQIGDNPKVRIIQQYRQRTFLGALSSIGGLLAALQGLFLLCFGRPLFWGLFGSKLLDPFGVFGKFANGLTKRAVSRYEFVPDEGFSSARGLGLFLSDFVVDITPLTEEDGGDSIEPQGGGTDFGDVKKGGTHSRSPSDEELMLLTVNAAPPGKTEG